MAMLADLLKEIMGGGGNDNIEKTPDAVGKTSSDTGVMSPGQLMNQAQKPPAGTITDDSGTIRDFNPSNPFANLLKGPAEQGTMRNFLGRVLGGGMVPGTGTVGGGGPADHVPGTQTDPALDPNPMAQQPQRGLQPSAKQMTAAPPPPDYSMPTALDPQSIEELRTSLLTQAGQMDINNPNGLSGRMNSPNAESDMGQQRNEAMRIEDSVRGFDGSKKAKIAERNRQ